MSLDNYTCGTQVARYPRNTNQCCFDVIDMFWLKKFMLFMWIDPFDAVFLKNYNITLGFKLFSSMATTIPRNVLEKTICIKEPLPLFHLVTWQIKALYDPLMNHYVRFINPKNGCFFEELYRITRRFSDLIMRHRLVIRCYCIGNKCNTNHSNWSFLVTKPSGLDDVLFMTQRVTQ